MVATMVVSNVFSAFATETLSGIAKWDAGNQTGAEAEVDGNGSIEYTVKCTGLVNDEALFMIELYDDSGHFFTTGTDVNAWYFGVTGDAIVGLVDPYVSTIAKDTTYKVTVNRNENVLTVTYFDVTNDKEYAEIIGKVDTFDDTLKVHFMAQIGTFEVEFEEIVENESTSETTTVDDEDNTTLDNEEDTTLGSKSTTTVASNTGDNKASTFTLLALAVVGATFIVLMSKKSRETE